MTVLKGLKRVLPGHLEAEIMEVMWTSSDISVRGVLKKLARPLAYTTVETTLGRLFEKDMLTRCKVKQNGAFMYSPRLSRDEWERERARALAAQFFTGPKEVGEMLISCLIDEASRDPEILDELERRIRLKRAEIERTDS